MIRPRPFPPILLTVAILATGCATQPRPAPSGAMAPAVQPRGSSEAMVSGESGLAISGQETPAALQALVAAPYVLPSPTDCAAMAREISDLDAILGPDVDTLAAARNASGEALSSAMRSAIPYRWVLRLMTQAGRRDRALRLAVLAGTARRGYLKGVRQGLACQRP